MTYVKIEDQLIPARICGRRTDMDWDGRESKSITCAMTYAQAAAQFVDGLEWSIVCQEGGAEAAVYDNRAYEVAGPITDNRDGTVTVKMGKATAAELLAELLGMQAGNENAADVFPRA